MQIEAKVFKGNKVVRIIDAENLEESLGFTSQLEKCFLAICKQLDVSTPLWMQKNTQEFARFHQTIFTTEQFVETINFDRLQLTWLDDGRNI